MAGGIAQDKPEYKRSHFGSNVDRIANGRGNRKMLRTSRFVLFFFAVCLVPLGPAAQSDTLYKIVPSNLGALSGTLNFADLNGDGKTDILLFNGSSSIQAYAGDSFDVWFGNGDGTFQHSASYLLGTGYDALEIADLNGDGRPDVVAAQGSYQGYKYFYNALNVYLNRGDGTFGSPASIMTYPGPNTIYLRDFNGDGKVDIFTVDSGTFQESNGNSYAGYRGGFSLFVGNGDGTFQPEDYMPSYNGEPFVTAVSSLRHDGTLGLVASFFGYTQPYGPTKTYIPGAVYTVDCSRSGALSVNNVTQIDGNYSVAPYYGDINGDGVGEVYLANYTGATVLFGNANGSFGNPVSFITNVPISAPYDFNGDGKADFFVSGNAYNPHSSIYFGKGDFTFRRVDLPTGVFGNIKDLNGDGRPDIYSLIYNSTTNTTNLSLYFNNGDGSFSNGHTYTIPGNAGFYGLADINGDGKPDIIIANSTMTYVLFANTVTNLLTGTIAFEGVSPNAAAQTVTFEFRPTDNSGAFTRAVSVGADGKFLFPDLLPKPYVVHIKSPKYLAANVSVDTTNGDVLGVTANLLAGDANNDNSVDSSDFTALIGSYNSDATITGSGYDPRADFNNDGFVDSTDFTLLIGNFNQVGDP